MLRVNNQILSEKVHLIDENGKSCGIVSRDQALLIASEGGYDLLEINPKVTPPICRLLDYGKYKYELEKKERKQRAKQKAKEIKEIRISLKIDEHDFEIKTKKAKDFLEKGHKIKISIILKGRERIFSEKAEELLDKFKENTKAEQEGAKEKIGNRISILLYK